MEKPFSYRSQTRLTLKERLGRLLKLNDSPHEIALGVAIGVFIGITPLYGFHTILVIVMALLIKRVNKIAMFLGTSVSTTPTVPFITWAGYSIGRFVLNNGYPPLRWDMFHPFSYKVLLKLYYPLFIGSVILGALSALISYFLVLVIARRWKKRHEIGVDGRW